MASYKPSQQGLHIGRDGVIQGPVSVYNKNYSVQHSDSLLLQNRPFCYNYPDFPHKRYVGHSEHLLQLKKWFYRAPGEEHSLAFHTIVVCGMGGAGKTTLVHRFIQAQTGYSDEKFGVIWLPAETEDLLETHFRTLATELRYDVVNDANRNDLRLIVEHVYRTLRDRKTLLVFDNAVINLANEYAELEFSKYLPKVCYGPNFKIIITSRNQDWQDLTRNVCHLDTLLLSDAMEYIENALADLPDVRSHSKDLAEFFDNLPIAIESAVDAVLLRHKRESVLENSYTLREFVQLLTKLENEEREQHGEDVVVRTYRRLDILWNQSLDILATDSKDGVLAIEMLDYLAFLSPNGVPVRLLVSLFEGKGISSETMGRVLLLLKSLSLVMATDPAKMTHGIKVHRLLQNHRVKALKNKRKLVTVYSKFLEIYHKSLTLLTFTDTDNYVAYSDNARTVCENFKNYILTSEMCFSENLNGLSYIVKILDALSMFNSEYVSQISDTILSTAVNLEHSRKQALTRIRNQAFVESGKYEQALSAYQEALKFESGTLGPSHPDTLSTKDNIAYVLDEMGRYEDALIAYGEVLRIRLVTLGENKPETLTTKHNIAIVLKNLGRHGDALAAYEDVLKSRSNILGDNHPDTLTTKHNIAGVLHGMGKYEEALKAYEEVLTLRSDILGETHPETLSTRHNIAIVLSNMGKNEDALIAYQEVLKLRSESLGSNHPDTLTAKHNLAVGLNLMGKFEDALKAYKEVLKLQSDILGNNHPETFSTRRNIAIVLKDMGKYEDALLAYQEVFKAESEIRGKHHPETLSTKYYIAGVLEKMGKHEDALTEYQEVLKLRSEILGTHHPDTLSTIQKVAMILNTMGQYGDAFTAYYQVLNLRTDTLGHNHPDTLSTMRNIAGVLENMGNYEVALLVYEDVVRIRSEVFGEFHPDIFKIRHKIATLLNKMGQNEDQEVFQFRSENPHTTQQALYTLSTKRNASVVSHQMGKLELASVSADLGEYDGDLSEYEEELRIRSETTGDNQLSMEQNMVEVLDGMSKHKGATRTNGEVLHGRSRPLGSETIDIRKRMRKIIQSENRCCLL